VLRGGGKVINTEYWRGEHLGKCPFKKKRCDDDVNANLIERGCEDGRSMGVAQS
jgi:hypothetical protein